jgi:hypothetical protein
MHLAAIGFRGKGLTRATLESTLARVSAAITPVSAHWARDRALLRTHVAPETAQ